ncbi:MAG: hypothetical protein QM703_01120 [Gemmatales bacterium]
MTKPMHRVKCQVESLEDRQLPTVTAVLLNGGTTLSITGDQHDESVTIVQNDGEDVVQVSWSQLTSDPTPMYIPLQSFQSSTIKKIVVNLGGGADSLNYQLEGNSMQWDKTIDVDMGAGNDAAFFDFGGNLIVPLAQTGGRLLDGGSDQPIDWPMPAPADLLANLIVNVKGGQGNDSIEGIFGNVTNGLTFRSSGEAGQDTLSSSVAGTMGPNARVLLDQDGGAGLDHLSVDLGVRGIMDGARVTVNQRGGAGNDQLRAYADMPLYGYLSINQFGGIGDDTIKTHALMDWQSTGKLSSRVYGEAGNDQMVVRLKREAIPPNVMLFAPLPNIQIDSLVNGGGGRNSSWVTVNIRTFLTQVKERSWEMTLFD